MKRFAELYRELESSSSTLAKRAALARYFREAPAEDAAWALYFLAGGKLSRIANGSELRDWIAARSGLPAWLVEDSYDHVGDLGETATLLLDDPPESARVERGLRAWVEDELLPVAGAEPARRRELVTQAWASLPEDQRLVFNKLITGSLRVGVAKRLVQQVLAEISGVDIALIAQRMLGAARPSANALQDLLSPEPQDSDRTQPYPFFLASPLEAVPEALGEVGQWLLEWKWDGIRLQVIKRNGMVALWSRGEERLEGRFPEIEAAAQRLPDGVVLDGELLAWATHDDEDHGLLPFSHLQRRINRLKPGPKLLAEVPVRVQVYDLLEEAGQDLRALPLEVRRAGLARLLDELGDRRLRLSPQVPARDWEDAGRRRDEARDAGVEGLMLKRLSSPYQVGRRRGDW